MGDTLKAVRMPEPPLGAERPSVLNADGSFNSVRAEAVYNAARRWPNEEKAALLAWLNATEARAKIRSRYTNAAEIAHAVNPDFKITRAVRKIARSIETVLSTPRANLLVTTPPQEGKSSVCSIWTPIRALQLNPNRRIILATYASALATTHSQACRDIITRHGTGVIDPVTGLAVEDKLGLQLSSTSNRVDAWQIEGGDGGLVAVGIGGPITGRRADLFIIDDPYKNMMEADSASYRRKVDEWFSSVVLTRLSPEASIILIQTRWHPLDLSGQVIAGERDLPAELKSWRHLNIPAIAEKGIPDALGREPGEAMDSALGRTLDTFERTRRQVGERVWYALYQGSPKNPAGGLFMRSWFDSRVAAPPTLPVTAVVGIDPADTGEDDETGIVGGVLGPDGTVTLAEDWSGQYTSDQWARKAVLLALQLGAREIAMEAYTTATTYVNVIKQAYKDLHREVAERRLAGEMLSPTEERALALQPPFTIFKWRAGARVDAVGRASLLRQAFETGRARTVEYKLGVFEEQAADWQAGQHQPDRVAAAIIVYDRLSALGSGQMSMAAPINQRPTEAPAWLRRKITG